MSIEDEIIERIRIEEILKALKKDFKITINGEEI